METDGRMESRTVVVSGIPDVLPVGRMNDKLTIHFQRRGRSDGGDVEVVRYPTNIDGVAFVTFDEAADAERVVRKERQIMADNEFPEDYLLTVFRFTRDVFFYVPRATVNLSAFGGDQTSLIESLRSRHRSLRFRPLLAQRKATIEGPFAAVRALREDLIRRAARLKPPVSAQTAAAKLTEAPRNPKVISHHEFVGSVSRGSSKAEPEPASSNGLSPPLQTTGEAAEVQSLLSNAKTQNASSRQKVSRGSLDAGSFRGADGSEEQRVRSGRRTPMEYRGERAKANTRQVLGEEINAGIRSCLSGLDPLPAARPSAKQPREEDGSQKHARADRISAAEIRGQTRLGSRHSCTDYLKELDQSSSVSTAKLPQSRLKDVSWSSESNAKDTDKPSAARPEHPEDTCVWVDSNTFRYIQKFEKGELDWCFRGLDASAEFAAGTDLTRITLTERQTSKAASRMQQALRDLNDLMEHWQLLLRVHQICYDKDEQPGKRELIKICDDVGSLYEDVLYLFEGSCIKVVGRSVYSYLFYKTVEDRIAKLRDNPNP